MRFCVCPLSVKSLSPSLVGFLKLSLTGLQRQILWGLVFPVQDPWAVEADLGLRTLTLMRESLQYNYSPVFGLLT